MKEKGQGLIEAIIALSAAVLIISALAMVVLNAVSNSDYTRIQNQATAYAQEQLEALKDMSKNDWNSFNAYDGTYCPDASLSLGTRISGNCLTRNIGNIYVKQVDITHPLAGSTPCGSSATGILIEVAVSWNDGRCNSATDYCHKVELNSCAESINSIPTP